MITVKVKDRMNTSIKTVQATMELHKAAETMVELSIGAMIVLDGETPIGMLTERDILRAYVKDTNENSQMVKDYMNTPLISISENASIGKAAQTMLAKNIRRLGVTNENSKIVGFCNVRDIIKGVHESFLALFEI